MNAGGGEAADQLVKMMLSGGEVTIRLTGSTLKNVLALTMALMKNRRTLSGKVTMRKMLQETRDLRVITLSPIKSSKNSQKSKESCFLQSKMGIIPDRSSMLFCQQENWNGQTWFFSGYKICLTGNCQRIRCKDC